MNIHQKKAFLIKKMMKTYSKVVILSLKSYEHKLKFSSSAQAS